MVLDGLDGLYDQRFGGPVGAIRETRAEIWLDRLLFAVAGALSGSRWEAPLLDVADQLGALIRSGIVGDELGDAALSATADLRRAVASAI